MTDPASLPYRPCVGRRPDQRATAWSLPASASTARARPGRCRRAASTTAKSPAPPPCASCGKKPASPPIWCEFVGKTHDWVTYDLPPELLGKVWGGKYRGQRQKWFLFRFSAPTTRSTIATEHPEFSTWRWIGVDEMVAEIVPFKRAVYDEVVRRLPRLSGLNRILPDGPGEGPGPSGWS